MKNPQATKIANEYAAKYPDEAAAMTSELERLRATPSTHTH